jgi:hypothetical protein
MSVQPATVARNWNWNWIRPIAFWGATFVIVFELAAGSLWSLAPIEWTELQLSHLGYPDYFASILGWWQVGAAFAIIAPGLPRLKEWAYAGIFFLWSGAVVSHLAVGDAPETWQGPLMFLAFAMASWALRPADRRLRPSGAGRRRDDASETRPRAWAIPMAVLAVLFIVSFATLPVAEQAMHERAVELGWIEK